MSIPLGNLDRKCVWGGVGPQRDTGRGKGQRPVSDGPTQAKSAWPAVWWWQEQGCLVGGWEAGV